MKTNEPSGTGYTTDVSDEEWAFVAPYLSLMKEDAAQRKYPLRRLFDALRWVVHTGCPWRMIPHEFPPWTAVHQQGQRWIKAGCFEAMTHDLRAILRLLQGRANARPTAMIVDSRTVQSTPESGARAGYDGHKRRKGSKVHIAVDTLGNLLALHVTAANEQDRKQVARLAEEAQAVTEQSVQIIYADQGYTGEDAAKQAADHGLRLQVVKLPQAKNGFILLPRRWVVERSFAWASRFRRLARDYERLPLTFAGLHWLCFAGLMLHAIFSFIHKSA